MGRPLPSVDVSYPVAQVGGQLSGVEIARPTGASRPTADLEPVDLAATELPFDNSCMNSSGSITKRVLPSRRALMRQPDLRGRFVQHSVVGRCRRVMQRYCCLSRRRSCAALPSTWAPHPLPQSVPQRRSEAVDDSSHAGDVAPLAVKRQVDRGRR